jgi:hypothetical protein
MARASSSDWANKVAEAPSNGNKVKNKNEGSTVFPLILIILIVSEFIIVNIIVVFAAYFGGDKS